jgi:hypothetical protein
VSSNAPHHLGPRALLHRCALPLQIDVETKAVLKKAAEAHRYLAELKGVALSIPNQHILIDTLSLQEARESSAIENIISTFDDIYQSNYSSSSFASPAAKEVHAYSKALKKGFELVQQKGLLTNSIILEIQQEIEHNKAGAIVRRSDRAGGTEGGMSNGEILRVSIAMKPISTVPKALDTIDVATGQAAKAINQRSDVCAVPAAGVVGEAMAALVLAEAVLEKFGGDSVGETKRNFESYMAHLRFK